MDRMIQATEQLGRSVDAIVALAAQAQESVADLRQRMAKGDNITDIAMTEGFILFPLLTEINQLLDVDGARLRRQIARVLRAERMPFEQIAEILGVSRQRVSALFHEEADLQALSDGYQPAV